MARSQRALDSAEIKMEIRKAKPEQAGEIASLNEAVQKMHAEHHPGVFKYPADAEEMERFFRDRMSDEDSFVFIARVSGQAVGYVWCTIERKPENVFKYAQEKIYIHQLSVNTEYRRKGVGRRLVGAVEALAGDNGISTLALDSWEYNKEAHAFFEQLGFSCFNINMWRERPRD